MSSAFFGSIVVAKQMSHEQDVLLNSPPVSPIAGTFGAKDTVDSGIKGFFRNLSPGGFPLGRSISNPVKTS
ncbi:hypothetical protein DSO57_1018724 [Entomophthora muscae]|uniref:Uncharacterized protein n=1 Tax=Entomophthora muscae TaxID=34485 RepID=A0ACC2RIT6_9FUNG|nr:hypothetical protein DSO57_1018724 [Entomophthora muscae]